MDGWTETCTPKSPMLKQERQKPVCLICKKLSAYQPAHPHNSISIFVVSCSEQRLMWYLRKPDYLIENKELIIEETYPICKSTDQPAHPRSLISNYVVACSEQYLMLFIEWIQRE